MKSYSDLLSEYRHVKGRLTEYQKAEFEHHIADAATAEKVKPNGEARSDFVSRVTGEKVYYVANRMFLYSRTGLDIAELWRRVDKGLPVKSAVNLFRDAMALTRTRNIEFVRALHEVLEDYDRQPTSTSKNGSVFRKRVVNMYTAGKSEPPSSRPAPEPPPRLPVVEKVETVPTPEVKSTRDFWPAIRSLCVDLVEDRLKGCDPVIIERTKADFTSDINVLLDEYQQRISRVSRTYNGVVIFNPDAMSLKEINLALAALQMDPIKKLGDELKGNYTQSFRQLAKQYHPDRNQGREDVVRPLFEEVREAKAMLDQYVELYVTKRNHGAQNA